MCRHYRRKDGTVTTRLCAYHGTLKGTVLPGALPRSVSGSHGRCVSRRLTGGRPPSRTNAEILPPRPMRWQCRVCGKSNLPHLQACTDCTAVRGRRYTDVEIRDLLMPDNLPPGPWTQRV